MKVLAHLHFFAACFFARTLNVRVLWPVSPTRRASERHAIRHLSATVVDTDLDNISRTMLSAPSFWACEVEAAFHLVATRGHAVPLQVLFIFFAFLHVPSRAVEAFAIEDPLAARVRVEALNRLEVRFPLATSWALELRAHLDFFTTCFLRTSFDGFVVRFPSPTILARASRTIFDGIAANADRTPADRRIRRFPNKAGRAVELGAKLDLLATRNLVVAFYISRVGLPCPPAWAREVPAERTLVATRELVETLQSVVV